MEIFLRSRDCFPAFYLTQGSLKYPILNNRVPLRKLHASFLFYFLFLSQLYSLFSFSQEASKNRFDAITSDKQKQNAWETPTQTFHGHFRYTVGSGYEIGLARRSVRCRALETNLSVKAPDFNYIFIPGTLLTPNSIDLCLIFPAECMKENSLLPFHPFRVAPWLLIKKGTQFLFFLAPVGSRADRRKRVTAFLDTPHFKR